MRTEHYVPLPEPPSEAERRNFTPDPQETRILYQEAERRHLAIQRAMGGSVDIQPFPMSTIETSSDEPQELLPIISPTEVTWPKKKDAVDLLREGRYAPPTREDAIWLVRLRFGCAYQWLPEKYQADPEIIMEAAVLSAGHTLAYVPEAARHLLDVEFFRKAFEGGVMPWAVKFASEEMQKDPTIGSLRAETDKRLLTKYVDTLEAARSRDTDAENVWHEGDNDPLAS